MPRGNQTLNATAWMERFWSKVDKKPDGCWLWTGATTEKGYGSFSFRRSPDVKQESRRVHRIAHELMVGPIPEGLQLDHLCRVRNCVNPAHLEPVTPSENTRRGESPSAVAARTDTCLRGHTLTDAYTDHRGRRYCRTCQQMRNQAMTEAKRSARVGCHRPDA